jgi:glycosyltransferase involved in cell wall biosynthesis
MRIWFAAAQKSDAFGGVHRSMSSLAGALRKEGHTVALYWNSRSGRRGQLAFMLLLLLRLLAAVFWRPDWIVARSSDGLFCALARRLGLVKTRVAIHSHGWEEKAYAVEKRLPRSVVTNPTTLKPRLVRFPLLRLALSCADACICGTVEEARWIGQRYRKRRRKIHVVPNGVDRPPLPLWPEQGDWPPSFLVVGGFTWKKNIEYALELFRRIFSSLPEARLFCVGTGPVPRRLKTLTDGLGDALFLVEREAPHKMFRWYETCPFLISASRYEGGRSLAILEAQAHGMVAFASAIPSSRELIRDGRNGVLLSGCDVDFDAGKIIRTCSDSGLCKALGSAAYRGSLRQSWERQTGRLLRVLKAK